MWQGGQSFIICFFLLMVLNTFLVATVAGRTVAILLGGLTKVVVVIVSIIPVAVVITSVVALHLFKLLVYLIEFSLFVDVVMAVEVLVKVINIIMVVIMVVTTSDPIARRVVVVTTLMSLVIDMRAA